MNHATDAELGLMDAMASDGHGLTAADAQALLTEVRKLRQLLASAWRIIDPMPVGYVERFRDTHEYDDLWLACIELGIVKLTASQVKRFARLPFEPYQSVVRLYKDRERGR